MFHFFSHHTVIEGDYNLEEINIEEELGRGNSHVFTAVIKDQMYALKQIQIKDDYEYRNFLQEITFMKDLSKDSECMVKYYGYFITKMQIDQYLKHKYAFIIMECAEMNLEQLICQNKQNQKRFPLDLLENFIETVLKALCELQAKHIAHCDIKPQNILIMDTKKYRVKLCDVGSCKVVTGQNKEEATILGTVPFLAPELIKIKSKKIVSNNAFKSDVFSFGLVFLYLITYKKFKSTERLETQESTYKQVIGEWVKEARQLINYNHPICELLKLSLEFNEFKRPLFKELKSIFSSEKKKFHIGRAKELEELEKQEEDRLYNGSIMRVEESKSFYQSSPSKNYINLFKSRKADSTASNNKSTINKTSTNGSTFRITTTTGLFNKGSSKNNSSTKGISGSSQSPMFKRRSVISSTSPDKNFSFFEVKRLIYITEKTKEFVTEITDEEEKTFVLETAYVPFKRADTISILPNCSLEVLYMLENVTANRLYLEYEGVDGIGLADDAPMLSFAKIRVNLMYSSLVGGYEGLFAVMANVNLQTLELRITESEVMFDEVIFLLEALFKNCPKLHTFLLCWQKNIMRPEEHFQMTQRLSKLPLRKLYLIMNENYIKYDKQMTWLLPKTTEVLYLEYGHNLLQTIVNNLCISLTSSAHIKELYLSVENNNLMRGEINMVAKSIAELKHLEKIILDLSYNKIEDLNYLEKNLSEHINLTVIEIRLHKTETSVERVLEFIRSVKELFDFKLKIFKVSLNRTLNLKLFKEQLEHAVREGAVKRILCDLVGFDNNYIMVYLKKKPKTFQRGHGGKASTSIRKREFDSTMKFSNNTISLGSATMTNGFISTATNLKSVGAVVKNPPSLTVPNTIKSSAPQNSAAHQSGGLCTRLYTMSEVFDNFMCLGCCESKQSGKSTFFCKFCIEHCYHRGHNIVKVYSRTKCSCSHSGCCLSDVSQNICAENLKILFKKKYECRKCNKNYCLSCIAPCKELHQAFVEEAKEMTYFTCDGEGDRT